VGAREASYMLRENNYLRTINLSDNGFAGTDAKYISKALQVR